MNEDRGVFITCLLLTVQNILNIIFSCFGTAQLFNRWWNIPLGFGGLIWLAINLIILLLYIGFFIHLYE